LRKTVQFTGKSMIDNNNIDETLLWRQCGATGARKLLSSIRASERSAKSLGDTVSGAVYDLVYGDCAQ
jgi:hypothetical protein